MLLGGRYGRMVVDVVDGLASSDHVGVLKIRRGQGFDTGVQRQNLLPSLPASKLGLVNNSVDSGVEVRDVWLDRPVVDSLTAIVDSLPLVPSLHLGFLVGRSEMLLDDGMSLDLRDPALNVGYNVRLEDVTTVRRGRLADVTLPCRDVRVGGSERVDVV